MPENLSKREDYMPWRGDKETWTKNGEISLSDGGDLAVLCLFFHAFFTLNLENAFSYELCIIAMATQHEGSYAFCYLKLQYMILTFG